MIRLALVGCGEHSLGSHAKPLARYAAMHPEEISLVAACDINLDRAQAFCRDFGFAQAYSDVDELLENERINACITVMPVGLIAETATKFLEKSIPCMIEKPLGSSIEEIERLAKVARKTGTPHMISVNRRFFPFLNRAVLWAKEQGEIQYARATMIRHKRSETDFIWSTAIHAVDVLRHIAGEIENYNTAFLRSDSLTTTWFKITAQFKGGATGLVEILPTAGIIEETYEIFGEDFRARIVAIGSGTQHTLHCWRNGKLEIEEFAASEDEDINNGGFGEVCEFIGALRGGRLPKPTVADVLPSARICLSIANQAESA